MSQIASAPRKIPPFLIIVGVLILIIVVVGAAYLSRPARSQSPGEPTSEAKAYLANLALSDVAMKAAENFMQQQVVEVDGKITNSGPRIIKRIEVICIFRDVNGHEIYRERVPIVQGASFGPGQTRSFRLPFDTLPEGWNQAMPNLVIGEIMFA